MRDHEGGAPELGEPALEPREPVEVEEVRGLVEQQHVRRLEQDSRQRRPVPPSSGQVIDGHRAVPLAEAQPAERGVDAVLVRPPVAVLHLGRQGLVPLQQPVLTVFGDALPERAGDVRQVRLYPPDRLEHLPQHRLDRRPAAQLRELREVADAQVGRHLDLAPRRLFPPQNQSQHRRLAGAVAPEQSGPVAGGEAVEDVAEHLLPPVPLGDLPQADEAHGDRCGSPSTRRREGIIRPDFLRL